MGNEGGTWQVGARVECIAPFHILWAAKMFDFYESVRSLCWAERFENFGRNLRFFWPKASIFSAETFDFFGREPSNFWRMGNFFLAEHLKNFGRKP